MNGIVHIARSHLQTAYRERVTLFWFIVFPLFLLTILTLIFGRIGREGEINFAVTLANMEEEVGAGMDFAAIVEQVFTQIGTAPEPGKEPLFTLHRPQAEDELSEFLAVEQEALRYGRRAAIIVIPPGFNREIMQRMISPDPASAVHSLRIYYDAGSPASEIATSIIEQILTGVDREILARSGRFSEAKAVPSGSAWVGEGEERRQATYIDFLLPGIILMAFFSSGLFGVPGTILFAREQRVLRRYWVTPLTIPCYFAGFSLGHLLLCLVQFILILLLGRLAFGATVSFAAPGAIFFLMLAAVTFLAFGFFVASIAKTANAGMAIANIINMPMMFLGGIFFPVGELPVALQALVYANPLTYLGKGLRASLGVGPPVSPGYLAIIVPLLWIVACTLIAAKRLKWDVER
ncbi:ABC transporter permease [Candidatus Bipolaricaulota bacterium]|nr:ABC transporter permease [Candidatus Bipolaricaulota bacterium]